ncbi:MAG: phage tail protein, partial [Rhodoluna sp.]|nr:phage tail protein [Rhodoluna sp.]
PKWTSVCKLSNCAYLYVKLKYDRNAFSGLPTITADVRGRTLFDPRDGQTRYSNNPALVIRDYLSNAIYGRGIASSAIDDMSIAAAANACDIRITAPSFSDIFTVSTTTEALTFAQPIPIDTGDGVKVNSTATLPSPLVAGTTYYAIKVTDTSYQLATTLANAFAGVAIDLTSAGSGQHTLTQVNYAAYACDGTIDTNQTAYDNVRALLTACRGMLVFSGGKYRLVLDVATTASSFGFTESNITGSWVISQAGKRAKYNRVTAGFYNPAKKWQPDLAMVESTALRATDNGLILEAKIDLPFTANSYRAQNIGQLTLNQSRYGLVVKFSAFQEGLRCEVGDVVPITHSTPGWSAKLFRIMQIEIKDNDEVYVVAREYSASVYTQAVLSPAAVIAQSNLPDPFSVPAVSGLALTSGTSELLRLADGSVISRIRVGWTAPTEVYAQKGQIEVQSKATTDLGWSPVDIVAADLGVAWVSPVQDSASYNVRIRAINSIGVRGAWSQ